MPKSVEELRAEKAKLDAELEAAKLEKEISEKKTEIEKTRVEVKAPDEIRITGDMQKAAQENDFDKFQKQWSEKAKMDFELENKRYESTRKSKYKDLYFTKHYVKSLGTKGPDICALALDIAEQLPRLHAVSAMLGKPLHELKTFKKHFGNWTAQDIELVEKALSSTGAGTGDEFVPTAFSAEVAERLSKVNPALRVLGERSIRMPSNPYRIPTNPSLPTVYYVSEGATVGSSDAGTGGADLDARKLGARQVYSGELEEDSIIPIMPFVEKNLVEALQDAVEHCLLFGDETTTANTNINLIDGTPTTTAGSASFYLGSDGLVKNCFATNGKKKDINADIVGGFADVMALMDVGALSMERLCAFSNVQASFKYMANSSFTTVEKIGDRASLLRGMIGIIFGVPFYPSSGIPKTNATGRVEATANNNSKGSVLIVNKPGVVVGYKRPLSMKEDEILVAADQRAWVANVRFDIKVTQANEASRAATGYGFNISL